MEDVLPRGVPQDVVEDIYNSLLQKCALTSNVLKVFRNCEIGTIDLSNCRGVTDEWLKLLSPIENEGTEWMNPCTDRFQKAMCTNLSFPSAATMQREFASSQKLNIDMDIDEKEDSHTQREHFCIDCVAQQNQDSKRRLNESWSTSSFFSATSDQPDCPDLDIAYDHDSGKLKEEERRPSMDETEVSDDSSNPKTMHSESPQISFSSTSPEVRYTAIESTFSPVNAITLEPPFCATTNTRVLDLRGCQSLTDRGLSLLSNLSCLEEAYLDDCHSLIGHGFSSLSSAHNLHIVSVRNCRRLTDEGVINLPQQSLETLILEGCRCLTDRSFIAISTMFNLLRLDVNQCDQLTDDSLAQLKDLKDLSYLNIGWCRKITDKGLDSFTLQGGRRDKLVELILARCIAISNSGVEHLSRLSSLKRLDINGCNNISSAGLGKSLQHLRKLSVLNASYIPGVL
jgi:Leucine Rich repeat